MLAFLPGTLLGIISFILVTINTLIAVVFIYLLAIVKLIAFASGVKELISRILEKIANTWVFINNMIMRITTKTEWKVKGTENLDRKNWYIVISNHYSNLDILVLQRIFNGKIPFLKFFLKKELIWAPFFGPAWWALDFPFMKRFSREFLKKNPHMKGKDIEATRKACEKFRKSPISIVNYVEGTRFKSEKHKKQDSPYNNLLKPRAGGVGFVISSMGELIKNILDVTIVYPDRFGIWDFMCNRVKEIRVNVDIIPLTGPLKGDYVDDENFKASFQNWLNELWIAKDRRIEEMLEAY
jgi:1-acyl-sn-glycerol-3-phosphate acyltransferase